MGNDPVTTCTPLEASGAGCTVVSVPPLGAGIVRLVPTTSAIDAIVATEPTTTRSCRRRPPRRIPTPSASVPTSAVPTTTPESVRLAVLGAGLVQVRRGGSSPPASPCRKRSISVASSSPLGTPSLPVHRLQPVEVGPRVVVGVDGGVQPRPLVDRVSASSPSGTSIPTVATELVQQRDRARRERSAHVVGHLRVEPHGGNARRLPSTSPPPTGRPPAPGAGRRALVRCRRPAGRRPRPCRTPTPRRVCGTAAGIAPRLTHCRTPSRSATSDAAPRAPASGSPARVRAAPTRRVRRRAASARRSPANRDGCSVPSTTSSTGRRER